MNGLVTTLTPEQSEVIALTTAGAVLRGIVSKHSEMLGSLATQYDDPELERAMSTPAGYAFQRFPGADNLVAIGLVKVCLNTGVSIDRSNVPISLHPGFTPEDLRFAVGRIEEQDRANYLVA